jgi:hypothetical protein
MIDFIGKQLEKIKELFETEETNPKNEMMNAIMFTAGNLLFVLTAFILVWKGTFFLYEYFFPAAKFSTTNLAVRTGVSQLIKSPWIVLILIAAFLFIVRLIVAIKVYIKPFHLLSIIGIAILVKKLWVIAFSKDYVSYKAFLEDFLKDIFR